MIKNTNQKVDREKFDKIHNFSEDYDIKWMCRSCHKKYHKDM